MPAVDELANAHGFEVLRSPVAHCELNPIELVWAQVKGWVTRLNETFRLADVKQLVVESLASVTPQDWHKGVEHVKTEEEAYWKADKLQEELVERLIIDAGLNSASESDSDDSNSSASENEEDFSSSSEDSAESCN